MNYGQASHDEVGLIRATLSTDVSGCLSDVSIETENLLGRLFLVRIDDFEIRLENIAGEGATDWILCKRSTCRHA